MDMTEILALPEIRNAIAAKKRAESDAALAARTACLNAMRAAEARQTALLNKKPALIEKIASIRAELATTASELNQLEAEIGDASWQYNGAARLLRTDHGEGVVTNVIARLQGMMTGLRLEHDRVSGLAVRTIPLPHGLYSHTEIRPEMQHAARTLQHQIDTVESALISAKSLQFAEIPPDELAARAAAILASIDFD